MACSESGGSKILLYLGLFVVVSSFCHCASLTRLKALDTFRESSTLNQGQTKGSGPRHGRLLIGQNFLQGAKLKRSKATKHLLDVDSDYQADMGWGRPMQRAVWSSDFSRPSPDNTAVERLLKMEPKVECTGDSMQLQVSNTAATPGSLFFVDRGSRLSPLPLSKLPPSCGYTIRSTQRDLVLVAPYDGCFVALEEGSYVLPLRWWGLTLRMLCPSMIKSSPNPPMVSCHSEGMVVKTEWTVSLSKIHVKLNGSWEPLMKASSSCGFSVVAHPEGVVISVHYAPCLEKKDGMYTLELSGDGETKISCPSLSPAQSEPTRSPDLKPQDFYQTPKPQPSAIPQVPDLPQTPGISIEKPDQQPKVIPQPQLPYPYFYPDFFYPYFSKTDTKLTTAVQPISTKSPLIKTAPAQSREPYYLFPFYLPPPQPVMQPTQPPVTKPPLEQPASQPEKPSYPFVFYPQPPALVKPVPPKPPSTKKPHTHTDHLFYPGPFYHSFSSSDRYQMPVPIKQPPFTPAPQRQDPLQPGAPQSPSAYMQRPQQVTTLASNAKTESAIPQPTNGGVVPPDFPQIPPVYCPQVCPSGFSNCCPQIAFHQYLHIVPAGLGGKRTGFGSSLGSAHPPQTPAEPMMTPAPTTSTSAPILLQSQPPGNKNPEYLQPPDGPSGAQHAGNPSKPANPEISVYPYFFDSVYPDWLYPIQNEELLHLPHSQSSGPYNVPLIPRALGNDPLNQMGQFEPYNVQPLKWQNGNQPPGNMNNPTGTNFMSYAEQNKLQTTAWELQPSNSQSSKSLELDHFQVPYYMVQDAQNPTYNKLVVPISSQPQLTVNASNEYTERDQTSHSSELNSHVLLQHGPPSREHNNWNESPLAFRDLVYNSNFLAQNHAGHHSNKPQQSSSQKQNKQPFGNGMSSPSLGNVKYIRFGDELGLPLIDPGSDGSHFLPLPFKPSTSVAHLKPKFHESLKDLWKLPMSPLSSSEGISPHIPAHFNHGSLKLNTK